MTGETERWGLFLEQRFAFRLVSVMAGQTITLTERFMHTTTAVLHSFMATAADLPRGSDQHAGIITAVNSVASLAVTVLYRHVLSAAFDVCMTSHTEPAGNLLDRNDLALNLVTFITVTGSHRAVGHLFKQTGNIRAMLRVAVNALGCQRIILMAAPECAGAGLMTRGAQGSRCHA